MDMNLLETLYNLLMRILSEVIWGRGVKFKGQIFNFVRFQRLRCQIVGLGPTIKSVHGDPFVRPFLRGQRSTERSNFKLCPILTVEVSNCRSRPHDRKLSW